MSSGVYALLGVLLGGAVTVGVTWWQGWRAAKVEWFTANRLVSHELERLMIDLRDLIRSGIPSFMPDTFMSTPVWHEYRATIARELKNNDEGDELWRGPSRLFATIGEIESGVRASNPGPVKDDTLAWLRDTFGEAKRAYESLTGVPSEVLLDAHASVGSQPISRPSSSSSSSE
jgi:hypothetical protein